MWFKLRETRDKSPLGTVGSVIGIAQTLVVGARGVDSSTGLVDASGGVGCTTVIPSRGVKSKSPGRPLRKCWTCWP